MLFQLIFMIFTDIVLKELFGNLTNDYISLHLTRQIESYQFIIAVM